MISDHNESVFFQTNYEIIEEGILLSRLQKPYGGEFFIF